MTVVTVVTASAAITGICARIRGRIARMATIAALALFVGAAIAPSAVLAQSAGTTPPIAAPISRQAMPEVQVVVAPLATGTWAISEVYPGQVPSAKAKARMNELVRVSGWQVTGPSSFEDEALDTGLGHAKGAVAPPVMSSVRCIVSGQVVDASRGTVNLLPFLQSLRELNRVSLVFLSPFAPNTPYHGVTRFESPQVAIDLKATQGTYLYLANIKDHGVTPLQVPMDEEKLAALPAPTAEPGRSLLPVYIVAAIAIGVLVFVWATKLMGGNGRQ